ncbi:hypothetical protein D3C78_1590630 [compost metagenome]
MSSISTVSVSSSVSSLASTPNSLSCSATSSGREGVSWKPDRLTETGTLTWYCCCHAPIWAKAVESTQPPISRISPMSSARGMNSAGETCPSTGLYQRSSAS